MKRISILLAALLLLSVGAWGQTYDMDDISDAFTSFAEEAAAALPFNTAIGLNWSDAYIGNFLAVPPSFGVGITAGATTMPIDAFENALDALGEELPSEFEDVKSLGVPIPAVNLNGRIGGFILPFDIGLKVGYIPEDAGTGDVSVDYLDIGADIRYALMKSSGPKPDISIGVGYDYFRGSVGIENPIGDFTIDIDDPAPDVYVETGDMVFAWETQVFDLKAQVSKSFLILTPYVGAGVSYSISRAGGGFDATLTDGTNTLSDSDISEIKQALKAAGMPVPDELDADGIYVYSDETAWAFRGFGGLSIDILILKLDLGALYNFSTGSLGASLGARIQI